MSKQKESKHISIWIPNSLLKECDINQIRYDVKTRSEFVVQALEFYNSYLFNRHISEYVNVEILNRMEAMLDSLENRIGRQMFKLIVESAKTCRILLDGLEHGIEDYDELHSECVKEAKRINGAIQYPFIKEEKNYDDDWLL